MKIAFIGSGVMGSGMILNLAKNNHMIHVYNRTFEKAKKLEQDNIKAFVTIEECIKDVELVITIVGYPKDVKEVYTEIFKYARNICCIDMTTSSPTLAKALYEEALLHNIYMLDAPVSGGDIGAKNGTLSIMCGGDKAVFDKYVNVLKCLGTNIIYTGLKGSGQHTKMANQIAIAGTIAGVCESLAYSIKMGLDPNIVLDAISTGAAGSWQMSNTAPRILNNDFNPGFYIKHFVKDMKLAIEEANNQDLNLIIVSEVLKMYQKLELDGFENLATSALFKYYIK